MGGGAVIPAPCRDGWMLQVLDVGSGSGVLAIFAAQAGAKKVRPLSLSGEIVGPAGSNMRRHRDAGSRLNASISRWLGVSHDCLCRSGVDIPAAALKASSTRFV